MHLYIIFKYFNYNFFIILYITYRGLLSKMSNNRNYKNIKDLEVESKTKNQLLELLKQGYPNIFNDGVLDLEKFKQEIGLENDLESKEKYGLN